MILNNVNLIILASLFVYINIIYFIALKIKKYSIIDIAWPFGFIITAFISQSAAKYFVLIWSIRLGFYLAKRNIFSIEDPRYTKYRLKWGEKSDFNAYFYIFMFQGFLMYLLSIPLIYGLDRFSFNNMSFINYLGIFFFVLGFSIESYADFYLSKFKKNNNAKICMTGPWKFCRFPNYLGEIVLWYGIFLITFTNETWWTVFAPILLNILIIKLTGVAPLEEKYSKVKEYKDYAAKTRRLLFVRPI